MPKTQGVRTFLLTEELPHGVSSGTCSGERRHQHVARYGMKSERARGANLRAALGNGGVHGVESAKERADRRDRRDKPAKSGDELGHARGLLGVVGDFAGYVHIQTRIRRESVPQLL